MEDAHVLGRRIKKFEPSWCFLTVHASKVNATVFMNLFDHQRFRLGMFTGHHYFVKPGI
jgi:hypothetical protein